MNNTLIKGLALLEIVARSTRPLGVTELSGQLGVAKSHAHRLLQSLMDMGYVHHDAGSRGYSASVRLWELGSAVLSGLDLRRIAQPCMEELQELTRETVHLSVLDGTDVVYVHKIDSNEPVRAYSQIGGRAPAHCVATGKAMLAWLPSDRLEAMSRKLKPYTANSLVDPVRFMDELAKVRRLGYAVNRGEWRDSVGGIGAPVRNALGEVVAAVGISGPIERLKPAQVRNLSGAVARTAQKISAGLGARSVHPHQLWGK